MSVKITNFFKPNESAKCFNEFSTSKSRSSDRSTIAEVETELLNSSLCTVDKSHCLDISSTDRKIKKIKKVKLTPDVKSCSTVGKKDSLSKANSLMNKELAAIDLNELEGNKVQTQKSLNAFFSPTLPKSFNKENVQNSGSTISNEERKIKMMHNGTKRVERALLTLDRALFVKSMATLARLPPRYLELISNPFVKYALQKEVTMQKRAALMKNMTQVEKAQYKEENVLKCDSKYDFLLDKFLAEKYEDTMLETKEMPNLNIVPLPDNSASFSEFESCFQITEFLFAHAKFLCKSKNVIASFSAETLHKALYSGKEGLQSCIGYILFTLADFLIEDGYKKEFKKLQNITNITKTTNNVANGILKLLKCLLMDEENTKLNVFADDKNAIFLNNQNLRRALESLNDASEFHHLNANYQLEIILHLMDKIISRDSFAVFITSPTYLTVAVKELKEMEAELSDVKKTIDEIVLPSSDEELTQRTRRQFAERSRLEKLKIQKLEDMGLLSENIEKQSQLVKELKEANRMRTLPLGKDRFHRTYWFFKSSPNRGVFVEEVKPKNTNVNYSDDIKLQRKCSKSFDEFLAYLEEGVCGRPQPDYFESVTTWYKISTKELFDAVMDTLCEKGVREGNLKKKMLKLSTDIEQSLTTSNN